MKAKPTAMQVRMDAEHRRLVTALAAKLDLTMSQVIRLAVRELAKRKGVL